MALMAVLEASCSKSGAAMKQLYCVDDDRGLVQTVLLPVQAAFDGPFEEA